MAIKFLSYILDKNTPTYGNRNSFLCGKKSSIANGDVANDSFMETTVHIGTHIDMPYHFFNDGQTIKDFPSDFWVFNTVAVVEIIPSGLVIKDELIGKLRSLSLPNNLELLIVKTGICYQRGMESFWSSNYGFAPELYDFFIEVFPKLRVLGFDSISVSSFADRVTGIESHKKFLNPENPILLLEDMDLTDIYEEEFFDKIIIAPLRIRKCDGLPCTIMGFTYD